jgi:hypothetical protein
VKKHARLGLSAKATLSVFLPGMETNFKPIKHWNGSSNGPIDLINRCASLKATTYVRLVTNDYQEESC